MTASDSSMVCGYQNQFVDFSYGEFICELCSYVMRDPTLTSCCGEHFCEACIAPVLQEKKPCPYCNADEYGVLLDKNYRRKILALQVYCKLKERGCQWVGNLEQFDAHLDANTGDCQYIDVKCPEKCGQQVQKHQLVTHIANDCPKRDYHCIYCGFKATYEAICNQHLQVCESYPVACPNGPGCDVGTLERFTLEDHLKMCHLQMVECEFSFAGCNEKLQRQDMEKHMEGNTQKHLALMASAMFKMGKEFEHKLQVQRDDFQKQLHEKQLKIHENEAKILKLQKQLQTERQVQLLRIPSRVVNLEHGRTPPCYFTVPHFTQQREMNAWWCSPPIYTHQYGYKFCIRVATNGYKDGKDTHVSLFFYAMRGEYDDNLAWPAKGTIGVELLNQHSDSNHHAISIDAQWPISTSTTNAWKMLDTGLGWKATAYCSRVFSYRFIAQRDLEWNAQTGTHYLKDNCLRLRLSKVKVHS